VTTRHAYEGHGKGCGVGCQPALAGASPGKKKAAIPQAVRKGMVGGRKKKMPKQANYTRAGEGIILGWNPPKKQQRTKRWVRGKRS